MMRMAPRGRVRGAAAFVLTSRGLARALLGVPLACLVFMLAVVSSRSRDKIEQLREHGVSTTGSVTPEDCSEQGDVGYRFLADAKEYRGAGYCPLDCKAVHGTAEVTVLYDRRDPNTSICEPLQQELGRMRRFFSPLIVGGVAAVGGIFWFTRRRAPRIVKAR
jgi:hypothetical protein